MSSPDTIADAKCLRCGYMLRGLENNRCPECGTEFDPNDSATMRVRRKRLPRESTSTSQILLLCVSALIFALLGRPNRLDDPILRVYSLMLWPVIAVLCSIRFSIARSMRTKSPHGWKIAVVSILLAYTFFALPVTIDECPHARYFMAGPIGVAYSEMGGPCYNSPHHGGIKIFSKWYFVIEGARL